MFFEDRRGWRILSQSSRIPRNKPAEDTESKINFVPTNYSCWFFFYTPQRAGSCSEGGSRIFHQAKWNTGPNQRPLGPRTARLLVPEWLFHRTSLIREAEKRHSIATRVEVVNPTHQQNRSGPCRANKITEHYFTSFQCLCLLWVAS